MPTDSDELRYQLQLMDCGIATQASAKIAKEWRKDAEDDDPPVQEDENDGE